jgi:CPA1 family monovalent cation:H+ antiporter
MDTHFLITLLLFFATFLGLVTMVDLLSKKTDFPYTIALLFLGAFSQLFVHTMGWNIHVTLPPEVIYFVLLPVLLFEAAMHINLHQFRLQFKTISFLATFGLLISVAVVGVILAYGLGMPFGVALLFGSLISATDPIAVLALFKTLGAPRRLSLLADGESMFNDATAVIAFRIIMGFVVAGTGFEYNQLFDGVWDFVYIFFGSLMMGAILGWLAAVLLNPIKEHRLPVSVLTVSLALGSFVSAEHFFHLSGVITSVMAGIVLGNLGETKMSQKVVDFIEKQWEFFGFISLSLVFFFAAFTLDWAIFFDRPERFVIVIASVLIARAVSVYITCGLSNILPFFNNEPNIPMSWQHILNWGGLRGVIPLVLAYSLPDSFSYKPELLAFTIVSLLFTIIFNGLTITPLLKKLGLHLPKKEEAIIKEFSPKVVERLVKKLDKREELIKEELFRMAEEEDLLLSLNVQAIEIKRNTLRDLFHEGHINENVFYQFESELDVQQDALEYPEVFSGRAVDRGGFVHSRDSYRARMRQLRQLIQAFPMFKKMLKRSEQQEVEDRYSLLKSRVVTSNQVVEYLDKVEKILSAAKHKATIQKVRDAQLELIAKNQEELAQMEKTNESVILKYQHRVLNQLVELSHLH